MPRKPLGRQESSGNISIRIPAMLCLSIIISESFPLVRANTAGNSSDEPKQQAQSAHLQRADPHVSQSLMVAIYCGEKSSVLYHNQYIETGSWKWRTDSDSTAVCTRNKRDVLNYCKKVYPNRGIGDIVESSRSYKLGNWCKLGIVSKRSCRTRLSVKPYRCLEGTLPSNASLVSQGCVLDHVHNKSVCESSDSWNKTAMRNCSSKSMKLQSFSMLQPCGLSVSSGIELVCCPLLNSTDEAHSQQSNKLDGNRVDERQSQLQEKDLPTGDINSSSIRLDANTILTTLKEHNYPSGELSNSSSGYESGKEDDEEEEAQYEEKYNGGDDGSTSSLLYSEDPLSKFPTSTMTTEGSVEHYLRHFDPSQERDALRQAEEEVERAYRDRIAQVKRHWSQMDSLYEEMEKKDSQASGELGRKMAQQFEKTIETLEEEGAAEGRRLASMHAERVMAMINARKRAAVDCLTQALDRTPLLVGQVERCMVKLLRALEKDRQHTLYQYKNLLNSNIREALHKKSIILDHLGTLNRAATQSIATLDRSPALVEKLGTKMVTLWHRVRNLGLSEPTALEPEVELLEKYEAEVAQLKMERAHKRVVEEELDQNQNQDQHSPSSSTSSSSSAGGASSEHRVETKRTIDNSTELVPEAPGELNSTLSDDGDDDSNKIEPNEILSQPLGPKLFVRPAQQENNGQLVSGAPIVAHHKKVPQDGPEHTHRKIDPMEFAHLRAESTDHELSHSNSKLEPIDSEHSKLGHPTFIASSCATIVIFAFVGVLYYRNNSSGANERQSSVGLGPSCPQKKSVRSMQFNGYENPAYRFFEAA